MPVEDIDVDEIIDIDNGGAAVDVDNGGPGVLVFAAGLGLGNMGLGLDGFGNSDMPVSPAYPIPIVNTR